MIPPTIATPLDIRALYARGKIYRRFDLPGGEQLRDDALSAMDACVGAARRAHLAPGEPPCPLLFEDEPELRDLWWGCLDDFAYSEVLERHRRDAAGPWREAQLEANMRAETARRHLLASLPTGAQLLARLLSGERVELEGHSLHVDMHVVWVTNGYGNDCFLFDATVEDCQDFIDSIVEGGGYGPTPCPSESGDDMEAEFQAQMEAGWREEQFAAEWWAAADTSRQGA